MLSSFRSAVSGIIDAMALGSGGGSRSSSVQSGPLSQSALYPLGSGGGLDDENRELRVIRQHLVKRRVRFLIAAVTRCALQIRFDPTTVLGIDVRDRNITRLWLALTVLGERVKRIAPSVFLRVVASRLLSRMLVPFVAVPVMIMWNIVLTQGSLFQARLVSLGAIGMERIARELLGSAFTMSRRVAQHNRRLSSVKPAHRINRPSLNVQVVSTRPLFHVPYHCLREMLMLITFFSHVVQEAKEIHPVVHSLLVELLSSCEVPDVCLWMIPKRAASWSMKASSKRRGRHKGHMAAVVDSASPTSAVNAADQDEPLVAHATPKRGRARPCSPVAVGDADNATVAGGACPTTTDVLPSRTSAVSWSRVLDLVLLDVGGSPQCALSATLRTFTKELNHLRATCEETSVASAWLHLHVEACPWPTDVGDRIELREHIRRLSIMDPMRVRNARFAFLVESVFPSWAAPSAMGPQNRSPMSSTGEGLASVLTPSKAVVEVYDDVDVGTDSDCTVELDQAAADDALRSASSTSPFSVAHVKMFLGLGVLLAVSTHTPNVAFLRWMVGAPRGPSSSHRLARFLLHLRGAYMAALRNHARLHDDAMTTHRRAAPKPQHLHPLHLQFLTRADENKFLQGVDALHASYWAGSPSLTMAEVYRIIDASSIIR
jgi:hypothetical protein